MMNNNLNKDSIKSSQQPVEKIADNETYGSNILESRIIRKLASLEQVIDVSIKKHEDKTLTLTRKKTIGEK